MYSSNEENIHLNFKYRYINDYSYLCLVVAEVSVVVVHYLQARVALSHVDHHVIQGSVTAFHLAPLNP